MKYNKRSALSCFLILVLLASLFTPPVLADDSDDDLSSDYSLYRISSAAAAWYSACHASDNKKAENYLKEAQNAGEFDCGTSAAGGMLGYYDSDDGWFGTSLFRSSASSQSYSYAQAGESEDSLRSYMEYGHALSQMGLDTVRSAGISSAMGSMISGLAVTLLSIAYLACSIIGGLFEVCIMLLRILNPFAMMSSAASYLFKQFSPNMGQWTESFSKLIELFSSFYEALSGLGYIILVILLGVLIFSVLFFYGRQSSVGGKIKNYIVTAVFIIAGVPIMGSLYTACLDSVSGAMAGAESPANYILASTLVDFQAWVQTNALALPSGVTITVQRGSGSGADAGNVVYGSGATTSLREAARKINASANSQLIEASAAASDASDGNLWNLDESALSESSDTLAGIEAGSGLLLRALQSASYTPATYNSYIRSNFGDSEWIHMTAGLTKMEYYKSRNEHGIAAFNDSRIQTDSDLCSEALNNLTEDAKAAGTTDLYYYLTTAYRGTGLRASTSNGQTVYSGGGNQGLSYLAVYNYLTSDFADSEVTISSVGSTGILSQATLHQSVSIIGSGLTRWVYLIAAVITLGCMAVLGVYYAFGVFGHAMIKSWTGLKDMAVALSTGSRSAMAVFCASILQAIIGVLEGVFFYEITAMVICFIAGYSDSTAFSGIVDTSFSMVAAPFGASAYGSTWSEVFFMIVGCAANIMITSMSVKSRKAFLKESDQIVNSLMTRIFGVKGAAETANARSAGMTEGVKQKVQDVKDGAAKARGNVRKAGEVLTAFAEGGPAAALGAAASIAAKDRKKNEGEGYGASSDTEDKAQQAADEAEGRRALGASEGQNASLIGSGNASGAKRAAEAPASSVRSAPDASASSASSGADDADSAEDSRFVKTDAPDDAGGRNFYDNLKLVGRAAGKKIYEGGMSEEEKAQRKSEAGLSHAEKAWRRTHDANGNEIRAEAAFDALQGHQSAYGTSSGVKNMTEAKAGGSLSGTSSGEAAFERQRVEDRVQANAAANRKVFDGLPGGASKGAGAPQGAPVQNASGAAAQGSASNPQTPSQTVYAGRRRQAEDAAAFGQQTPSSQTVYAGAPAQPAAAAPQRQTIVQNQPLKPGRTFVQNQNAQPDTAVVQNNVPPAGRTFVQNQNAQPDTVFVRSQGTAPNTAAVQNQHAPSAAVRVPSWNSAPDQRVIQNQHATSNTAAEVRPAPAGRTSYQTQRAGADTVYVNRQKPVKNRIVVNEPAENTQVVQNPGVQNTTVVQNTKPGKTVYVNGKASGGARLQPPAGSTARLGTAPLGGSKDGSKK